MARTKDAKGAYQSALLCDLFVLTIHPFDAGRHIAQEIGARALGWGPGEGIVGVLAGDIGKSSSYPLVRYANQGTPRRTI